MKYGFDSTAISAKNWEILINDFGLKLNSREDNTPFEWTGNGILVATGNNPVTGEYRRDGGRSAEKGYASYIGLEGDAKTVQQIADFITANAEYIKDTSPGERDFI